ncbi:O-fucosyltransferase family protein [bacterium]|nr:O-fucosyltransferase family protein [bacterium]
MLNNIKKYIKNHKKLNYLQRCIRRINDNAFVDEVLEIGKNPLRINIQKLGDKNDGKLVYIAQTMGCDGFFAELRYLLNELYFADKLGLVPVLTMSEKSSYAEKEPINGTTNPFEYYFLQPTDISLETAKKSFAVVEHNWIQKHFIKADLGYKSGYAPIDEYFDVMSKLMKKYLRFNEDTKNKVCKVAKELIGDAKTLGIHIRGADFKRHYDNHPNMVTIEEYATSVEETLKQHNFEKIFLATDDSEAIETFAAKFGDKLVYYKDVIRTSGDETVMKSEVDRPLHHYHLGLEVIRDSYTLSICDGLIAGLSNVSIFSRLMKQSEGLKYDYLKILDKGIKNK